MDAKRFLALLGMTEAAGGQKRRRARESGAAVGRQCGNSSPSDGLRPPPPSSEGGEGVCGKRGVSPVIQREAARPSEESPALAEKRRLSWAAVVQTRPRGSQEIPRVARNDRGRRRVKTQESARERSGGWAAVWEYLSLRQAAPATSLLRGRRGGVRIKGRKPCHSEGGRQAERRICCVSRKAAIELGGSGADKAERESRDSSLRSE